MREFMKCQAWSRRVLEKAEVTMVGAPRKDDTSSRESKKFVVDRSKRDRPKKEIKCGYRKRHAGWS